MRRLRRRTREGVEVWIGWLSRFKLIRLLRISLATLQMDGWRDGQRGGCGFSSLMKQKIKGKNCVVFCFAGKRKIYFFIYEVITWEIFYELFRLYYFAGPTQLSLLSKCKRYILNTSLMLLTATRLLPKCKGYILNDSPLLRTFGRTRYTLKVAFLLNVRAVSPQSHPRCMVNQPTFETVKVPIMIVFLSFANHPTPRTVSSTPMCSHSALHPA